jgi:septal ring factor EnvC (AmiA/AmiB activator)
MEEASGGMNVAELITAMSGALGIGMLLQMGLQHWLGRKKQGAETVGVELENARKALDMMKETANHVMARAEQLEAEVARVRRDLDDLFIKFRRTEQMLTTTEGQLRETEVTLREVSAERDAYAEELSLVSRRLIVRGNQPPPAPGQA